MNRRKRKDRNPHNRVPVHEEDAEVYHTSFIGPRRGSYRNTKTNVKSIHRFGVLLSKDNEKYVGKVITSLIIEDWAKLNGFVVLRYMKFDGYVNKDIEKTEVVKC